MRRFLSMSLFAGAMLVAFSTTSCATSSPGKGFWSHMTRGAVKVRVKLPFLGGTWVENLTVDDIRRPKNPYWENCGSGGVLEGWAGRSNFRLHSEGAIIDTVYYVFDGIRTNVAIRRPRQRMWMEWSVPNMENDAAMTMEVVVYMHVEGGPITRWPSKNDPASFTLIQTNIRNLRESVPR